MKCLTCNGTGKERRCFYEKTGVDKWEKVWDDVPCEECNGTGEIEVTNEEWLEQASTEEKAKLLSKLCKSIYNCGKKGSIPKIMYEEDWEYWLGEIHND